MKRILSLVAIAAATVLVSQSTASAQGYYDGGYQFGAGIAASRYYGNNGLAESGGGFGHFGRFRGRALGFTPFPLRQQFDRFDRPTDMPYFAKFPPVYYSHVVKRPYGVSPFAAPSGIVPVEMSAPVPMMRIQNPYMEQDVDVIEIPSEPVETDDDAVEETASKTTWIQNPYINSDRPTSLASR